MTMAIMTLLRHARWEKLVVLRDACAGVCEQLSSSPAGGEHFQRPQDFKSANITCTGSESDDAMKMSLVIILMMIVMKKLMMTRLVMVMMIQ